MQMKDLIIHLDFQYLRNETHVELNEEALRLIGKYNPSGARYPPSVQCA
jgi:hypothetical protein